jgi:hypothetical protein
VVTADAEVVADETAGELRPLSRWTLEASVLADGAATGGVIAVVIDADLGPVRALLVRRGELAVLAWSWRGALALWSTNTWTPTPGAWSHVAASSEPSGDLALYADGRLLRVFQAGGLVPGRGRQRLVIGEPVRFYESEVIPGWSGRVRNVKLHGRALSPEELGRRARVALNIPEPAVEAPAVPEPEPVGCSWPVHLPAWRSDGEGGLRCLECAPPRGCDNDDHERYWRPRGHDMRITADWWVLVCALCETAAQGDAETA